MSADGQFLSKHQEKGGFWLKLLDGTVAEGMVDEGFDHILRLITFQARGGQFSLN